MPLDTVDMAVPLQTGGMMVKTSGPWSAYISVCPTSDKGRALAELLFESIAGAFLGSKMPNKSEAASKLQVSYVTNKLIM